MHTVKSIKILWSENRLFQRRYSHEPVTPPTFKSFGEVNSLLINMSMEGTTIGYDKTAFRVTWSDGFVYQGRYDIVGYPRRQDNPNGFIDLADHIRSHVKFCSGQHCPPHMNEKQYKDVLSWMVPTQKSRQTFRDLLTEYQLA